MVIVDTSVWIRFLRQPRSEAAAEVRSLLRRRRAAITGVILAEVLQGARSAEDYQALSETLGGLPYLETTRAAWSRAGAISMALRKEGRPLPLTDVSIAAVAIHEDLELFTFDPDFQRIPNLRLYNPDKEPSDA
jgi:tRNA(fMet)-specific endonuclease VapC